MFWRRNADLDTSPMQHPIHPIHLLHPLHPPPTYPPTQAAGKRVFFVTNNATKHRSAVQAKFKSKGLEVPTECIVTAGSATAEYLAARGLDGAYLIGEPGLAQELQDAGVRVLGGPDDADRRGLPPVVRFHAASGARASLLEALSGRSLLQGHLRGGVCIVRAHSWCESSRRCAPTTPLPILIPLTLPLPLPLPYLPTHSCGESAVGFDSRFNYRKLALAAMHVQARHHCASAPLRHFTGPPLRVRCG